MAQEAALTEIANSSLRRLSAFNKSSARTDVQIGDTVLPFKAQRGKGTSRRRGPALILDIDETGVKVKFRSQTFKVGRFPVRKKGDEKIWGGAELDPLIVRFRRIDAVLGLNRGKLMRRRIGRWTGKMGILPRARVHRRAILGLDQK